MSEHTLADEKAGVDEGRRNLFKLGAAAVGTVALGTAAATRVNNRIDGLEHDEFPFPVADDCQPMQQRNTVLNFVSSPPMAKYHPERNRAFGERVLGDPEFQFQDKAWDFMQHRFIHNARSGGETKGFRQLDYALERAAWEPLNQLAPASPIGVPNTGMSRWDQSDLNPARWQFDNGKDANTKLKSAAKLYGAVACGITRRDKRWDYDPLYNALEDRDISWDELGFVPKSVIVVLVEEDYLGLTAAPTAVSSAAFGWEYGQMALVAGTMAKFIRELGYKAVAAGNDMGISVAYATAAGLGEPARFGGIIVPTYGARVRIAKVYTEMEFDDDSGFYDKPRTFGMAAFCAECKRCAEQCPSGAISKEDGPTDKPVYPGADDPDYAWHHHLGVTKYYNDAKRCFNYWMESDTDCGACKTSCPWNKPNFWHHRMIEGINGIVDAGPVHNFMARMDELFGYGNISDEAAVDRFWQRSETTVGDRSNLA